MQRSKKRKLRRAYEEALADKDAANSMWLHECAKKFAKALISRPWGGYRLNYISQIVRSHDSR